MKPEHESLGVRALDSEGYDYLATKLDDNGFRDLTKLEQRTTITTTKKWEPYLDGDVESAIEQMRAEV